MIAKFQAKHLIALVISGFTPWSAEFLFPFIISLLLRINDVRVEVKVERIDVSTAMIYQDNNTPRPIGQTSLLIRSDTSKPSRFRTSIDTFVRGKVNTRVAEVIKLVEIIQRQWRRRARDSRPVHLRGGMI
jgi:hypothetical protein